jgi:hypothetical protein
MKKDDTLEQSKMQQVAVELLISALNKLRAIRREMPHRPYADSQFTEIRNALSSRYDETLAYRKDPMCLLADKDKELAAQSLSVVTSVVFEGVEQALKTMADGSKASTGAEIEKAMAKALVKMISIVRAQLAVARAEARAKASGQ